MSWSLIISPTLIFTFQAFDAVGGRDTRSLPRLETKSVSFPLTPITSDCLDTSPGLTINVTKVSKAILALFTQFLVKPSPDSKFENQHKALSRAQLTTYL